MVTPRSRCNVGRTDVAPGRVCASVDKHRFLDSATHRAAAQHKIFDGSGPSVGVHRDAADSNQAVVTKFISHAERDEDSPSEITPLLKLACRHPPRPRIHLIRFFEELGRLFKVSARQQFALYLKIQGFEPFVDRQRRGLPRFAAAFGCVALCAISILSAYHADIEAIQAAEGRGKFDPVLRPLGDQELRNRFAHARTFDGIIIVENRGVAPEIELLDQLETVLCLIVPVDPPTGKVVQLEHHLRMFMDSFQRIGSLVLTHDPEHHAAPPQR
jgi:hypothetical protein